MQKIMIVEDDLDLADITQIHLQHAGFSTVVARCSSEAFEILNNSSFDLILLDMLLPDSRGEVVCRSIRENFNCPIIFMSCLDDSGTVISALSSGGDDYVVKPIKYDELLARIESNIRRYHGYREYKDTQLSKPVRSFKRFSLDTIRHRLIIAGEEVELSSIEYSLLLFFTENINMLLLYDDLYNKIWGHDSLGDIRTVMVHISNLRKKIDPQRIGLIETVRGAGYIFSDI